MPKANYIDISIDGARADIKSPEDLGLAISYKLEDPSDFQTKTSSDAFDITIPATLKNDQINNSLHDPEVEDLTSDNRFRNFRSIVIEANGIELLVGKGLLKNASHDSRPINYKYDCYGDSGSWMIDLKEKTLYDFLRHITINYTKEQIIASWAFDGTDENLPYVFAPVRYGQPMDPYYTNLVMDPPPLADDYSMGATYLKPSISKYWILYWAFKSIGYRIASDFFDSEYFRRQVLLWTWGSFDFISSGDRLNNLDFLAKSDHANTVSNGDILPGAIFDLFVTNDSVNGGFDNNGVYEYDAATKEMKWTYLQAYADGDIEATFHMDVFIDSRATNHCTTELRLQWFRNGVKLNNGNDNGNGTLLMRLDAPLVGAVIFNGNVDDFLTVTVHPGDVISAKIFIHVFDNLLGTEHITANVDSFELDYIRVPLGGTKSFEDYTFFNKWKVLDFLAGVIDEFNLMVATDPVNKVVYVEPTHPYSLEHDQSVRSGGYFNGKFLNWESKQDLSKVSNIVLNSDSERELIFKYKDDSGDGILKLIQERNINTVAAGKFVLPDRFKSGKDEFENRFFSPTMHYDVIQWRGIGTLDDSPQMICIVPENISNTSASEAQNAFEPKSAYYKGLTTDWGWVFDTEKTHPYPFMFAVNYKPGGEEDPILSYSDERIGDTNGSASAFNGEIGVGLLRRFYLQRLAIMRNGLNYDTYFKLNNIDVTNWLHREHIVCGGQKWELIEIRNYSPLTEQTTAVSIRKWSPIIAADRDNVFPSENAIINNTIPPSGFDTKYARLLGKASDIPT